MKEIKLKTNKGEVTYYLTKRKNMKNLHLRVKEDLKIYVSAPYFAQMKIIDSFVLKRLDWVEKAKEQIRKQNQLMADKKQEENQYFLLFGSRYLKKLVPSEECFVSLKEDTALVYAPSEERAEKLLEEFYRDYALRLSYKLLQEKKEILLSLGLKQYPEIKLRKMKARWGSCYYTKGKIMLNTELFKYPVFCIEFVLLHELCHFREHNHSKAFYQLLTSFMPDWRNAEKILHN